MRFLILISCLLVAPYSLADEEKKFGNWVTTSIEGNGVIIVFATTSSETSTLGFMCISGKTTCFPYVSTDTICKPEAQYPMLISIDGHGVDPVLVLCEVIENTYIYNLPSNYTNLILESNKLGIAYALSDVQFKASYFNLDGSAKALIAAKKMIGNFEQKNPKKEIEKSSTDVYL